jgi:hypothetical protein
MPLPRHLPLQASYVEHKPWKGHGVNNPGYGLSDNMTKIMSHSCQPDEASLRANKSLVWSVAPRPNTADSIIRHRYDDPKSVPEPAKVRMRPTYNIAPACRPRRCGVSDVKGVPSWHSK